MPPVVVGQEPSSGVGGIPTRYLVIGAGVLGVGALLIWQSKKGAPAQSGDAQPTGSTSAQLSSVQQMQLQQFGDITKMFAAANNNLSDSLAGLSGHLDTQAAGLSSSIADVNSQLQSGFAGLGTGISGLQTGIGNLQTGQSQIYQQNASYFDTLAQAIYQTFQRASNPYAVIYPQPQPTTGFGTPENVVQAA